ncbi:MAG: XdhC family protein, partial [Arenimonas sp.]
FARLAALLANEPVVMASVLHTLGATPRKRGARMLVTVTESEFSIGGGLAEARVIAAARDLLQSESAHREIEIDLSGAADAAGVCGGRMRLALRRWVAPADIARARNIASTLAAGSCVELSAADLGAATAIDNAAPDDRLLIIGGGHCGLALYELAVHLDFDLWVFDEHPAQPNVAQFPLATRLSGNCSELARAVDTSRRVHAVLLNRDFQADIAALRVLARRPPDFMSMMGSARRIAEVRAALPECAAALALLTAPVGLEIGAHTPHEIAVSILAQVIANRHAPVLAKPS